MKNSNGKDMDGEMGRIEEGISGFRNILIATIIALIESKFKICNENQDYLHMLQRDFELEDNSIASSWKFK